MFAFKQFTIHQERTAMKVCTDACMLGAYADVGGETDGNVGNAGANRVARILDIGTGTGLLALMAAQRNRTAQIDAVEIDDQAFVQATENVRNSPFAAQINVVYTRIQEFVGEGPYDRILTNPPFYTNHLRSPDVALNRALHNDDLPVDELMRAVIRLLKPGGQWWVLLPRYETGKLIEQVKPLGLWAFQRLFVRHHAHKPPFRVVTGFSFESSPGLDKILTIYEPDGRTYTDEFRDLLRDYYLIF